MKPKAIFLLEADAFRDVFGVAGERELTTWIDFVAPALTATTWQSHATQLSAVELIFTGWGTPIMDAEFLQHFPALRFVFHAGGTVKHFATEALWARGVRVSCAAAMNAIPVAEFTLSQIIFCLKHGWQRVREVQLKRHFQKDDEHMPGVYGSTVGLLALSRTGQLVAEHLRKLAVDVIAFDPVVSPTIAAALGVRLCSLADAFALSHVVSCHMPLLPETTRVLRRHHFSAMKPGASFINTARGPIVHEPELLDVLARRPDLFALLDVTDPEPPRANSRLFKLPNVIVTPHIAGSLGPECRRLGRMMIDETRRYLRNESLQGEVMRAQLSQVA